MSSAQRPRSRASGAETWGGDVAEEGIVSGGARGGRDAVAEVREEVDLVVVGSDHTERARCVARGECEVRSGAAARLQQTLALQFPERAFHGRAACAEPARERLLAREAFVRFVFAVQDFALERVRNGKVLCGTFGHGASISFRLVVVAAKLPPERKTCQCSFFRQSAGGTTI